MTSSTLTDRRDRSDDVSRRRWWVLAATLGALLVAVPLVVSRPAIPAEQVGVASTSVRPNRVSRRRWWGLGAALGALLVAVILVVATPSTPAQRIVPVRTPGAASFVVPEVATTDISGGVAPAGAPAPAPLDAPRVAPAEHRIADDAVSATPASDVSTLPRSAPTRVRIPAIELDSELIALGLEPDGRMEVPPGAFPAGWYAGAPTPGELGPAILAGHVDYGGSAGVFSRLGDLEAGDSVEVSRQDGSTAVFRVTRVEQHDKDDFPTAAVYGDIDHAGLRLITCGGQFDQGARSYEDNIVVFAELDIGEDEAGRRPA